MKMVFLGIKGRIALAVMALPIIFGAMITSGDVHATVVSADELQKIAILQGVKICYNKLSKTQIYVRDFSNLDSVLNHSGAWSTDGSVLLPTKVGNTINDSDLKCQELFYGYPNSDHGSSSYGTSTGLASYYTFPTNLTDLGYVFDHTDGVSDPDSAKRTIQFSIKDKGGNLIPTTITGTLSVSGTRGWDDGWLFSSGHYYWDMRTDGTVTFTYDNKIVFSIEYQDNGGESTPFFGYYDTSKVGELPYSTESGTIIEASNGNTTGQFVESFDDAVKVLTDMLVQNTREVFIRMGIYSDPDITVTLTDSMPSTQDPSNQDSLYVRVGDGNSAAEVMLAKLNVTDVPMLSGEYITGGNKYKTASAWWTADHKYSLYYNYLQNIMKDDRFQGIKVGPCGSTIPEGAVYAFKGAKNNWCAINIPPSIVNSVLEEPVNIVGAVYLQNGTFSDVLDWFGNESSYQYMSDDKYAEVNATEPTIPDPIPGTEDEPDDGTVTDEDLCYRNARSLGWIICPVIFGAREMADSIYQAIIPLIQTNESIVGQLSSNDSGLYKAWAIFRNLANIIFVILFMIIIFSQLTGYGIDNYGIKRMLPKVIVTAILINLSFIICALAVDITNIIGTSIKGLFETIGAGVGNAVVTGSFGEAFGQVTQKVINALAILGPTAIIAGISIQMNGWAIVVPILLFLLTTVIAIFFALVVLGMRQALVVILIVLSPLAFACNMLPNTENIFKKWWSTAKTMLMVYPIVGALTGIGYLTARILLSADSGFIMVLVSGVLMVGPYFLIPSLTRKALDSVGSLGSRIGNIGRGARTGARNRINGSEAVKNFRGDHRDAATARRASRYLNSRQGRATEQALRDGKPISSRRANRYARAQAQANSSRKANLGAYDALFGGQDTERRLNRMQTGGFAAMEAGLANKAFEGDVADQAALWENDGTFANDTKFEDAVYNAAVNGEDAKLEALMRKAASGSDKQRENLFKGMSRAFASGNVGARTAGRYGAHLTSNGIYKSNDPSAYGLGTKLSSAVGNGNYGTSIDPKSFTQENYAGSRIFGGKVASASAFNFDDAEFNALAEKAKNGTAEERQQLANFMQGALDAKANDTTGQYNNVKPETIEQIKKVLDATGMTPQAAGETLTVDHSAAASAASDRNALDAYTESVIKRVLDTDNGGITAEEGKAMIRRAEEHWKQKHGGK